MAVIYVLLPLGLTALYFAGSIYKLSELIAPYNLSIIAGVAAYVTFMSQFLLSARLPLLERRIPQDRLLALHGTAGLVSVSLVVLHFTLKYILVLRYGTPNLQTALGILALILSAILTPLALLVLQNRRQKQLNLFKYQTNKVAHNFFALAGLAAVIHVVMASSTWSILLKGLVISWGLVTLGAYVRHKFFPSHRRINLRLQKIKKLTPNVYSYQFSTADGSPILKPRFSGQFGYYRFLQSPTGPEEHPFTISSPSTDSLEVVVRSSGDFTQELSATPLDSAVSFDGPYGHFHLQDLTKGTPLVFLSGGIGITPVLSIARDKENRIRHPMAILWSIHSDEDKPIAAPLADLANQGALTMHTIVTSRDGHVDKTALKNFLRESGIKKPADAIWFLCGPPALTRMLRILLCDIDIAKKNIREERFSW